MEKEVIKVNNYILPKNLYYSEKHHWVKIEDNKARIGITDYAQKKLKDIVYIELPNVGDEITKGESYGVVESIKAAEDLYAPLTGKVLEVNEEVISNATILNEDPYEKGWLLIIEITNPEEVKELLTAEKYAEIIKKKE